MSGTDEPRIWTLNVQSEGQASWTLICRGWWLSPIETIEVVEKSAYDAAVERAEGAENIRDRYADLIARDTLGRGDQAASLLRRWGRKVKGHGDPLLEADTDAFLAAQEKKP